MSKVWNPGASRETVGEFLGAWCVRGNGLWSRAGVLFGAYECYCRASLQKDLTIGEFQDELERMGLTAEERYGQAGWSGIGLGVMEDAIVGRRRGR